VTRNLAYRFKCVDDLLRVIYNHIDIRVLHIYMFIYYTEEATMQLHYYCIHDTT